jgi:5'(3')-deoxyribonucleotidase
MIKSLVVAFNFIVVLALSNIFGGVSITQNIPDTVEAGQQFTVTVTIDKSNIGAFGRYQLELPNGFEAKAKDSNGGAFSFSNQKLRIQWLTLPYDDRFTISFEITVPATIDGEFPLNATFAFIKDNNPTKEEIPTHTLTVKGNESVEDLTAVNTYNYKGIRMKEIDCIRQKPYMNEDNEIIVNLLVVNKVGINEFGKIQEQIPRGYKAIALRSKNAMFTNNGRILKFMWMTFPPDEHFVVTYKLIRTEDIPNQVFLIKGELTYTRNGRNQMRDIAERNVDLEEFAEDELVVDNSPMPIEDEKPKKSILDAGDQFTGTTYVSNETDKSQNKELQERNAYYEQKLRDYAENTGKTNLIDQTNQYSDQSTQSYQETNYSITNANGVTYRVQVAAGHKLVNDNYFRNLKLNEYVQIEIHQGWHKYTVGSHKVYKGARDHRNQIWQSTPIKDAFVCAYNDGQRITVQEALMIANQKWYK